jgi:hypothetical protein
MNNNSYLNTGKESFLFANGSSSSVGGFGRGLEVARPPSIE